MNNHWASKRTVQCKCGLRLGTCSNIECPHSLLSKEIKNSWVEGWALSKYSEEPYKKTRIGSLIKRIKYDHSIDYLPEDRISDATTITREIIEMIRRLYDPSNLPFDLCVCPPSHEIKPLNLPDFICKKISGGRVKFAEKAIIERMPLKTIKSLPKPERSAKLLDNFVFVCGPDEYPRNGILIVADVFDTGSTITGVSRAVAAEFPNLPRFVLTAAYIGQMGKVSAV